jgi:hypothetical protein
VPAEYSVGPVVDGCVSGLRGRTEIDVDLTTA